MSVYGGPGGVGGMPPQGQGYAMPPKVRFDAIGEAWKYVQAKMGVWVVAVLIYLAIIYAVSFLFGMLIPGLAIRPGSGGSQPQLGPGFFLGIIAQVVVVLAASALFMGGLFKMALKQIRGEEIAIGDLFSATDVIGPLIVTAILVGLGIELGAIFCVIPGLILGGLWMLALPIVVDQKVSPTQAISMSMNALKGDMLTATLFYFVLSLVASIGGVLCGVGALFTFPLLPLGLAITYRDFFLGGNAGPQGPTLDMPLPPPSAYQPGQYPPPPPQQ